MNRLMIAACIVGAVACAPAETPTPSLADDEACPLTLSGALTAAPVPGNGTQFAAVVDAMSWGGDDTWPDAPAGTGTTSLTMTAASDANCFVPAKAGPNGTIIARIDNGGPGTQPDNRYGTRPAANQTFYLVVDTAGTWSVIALIRLGNAPPQIAPTPKAGGFSVCQAGPKTPSRARFNDCPHLTGSEQDTSVASTPRNGDSDWITCEQGCCQFTL